MVVPCLSEQQEGRKASVSAIRRSLVIGILILSMTPACRTPEPLQSSTSGPATLLLIEGDPQALTSSGSISVHITVQNASDLSGFEFNLGFDPILVDFIAASLSGSLGDTGAECDPSSKRCATLLTPLEEQEGVIAIGAYSYGESPGIDGDAPLATVRLRPTGATGVLTLTMGTPIVVDSAGRPAAPTAQPLRIELWQAVLLPLVLRGAF